MHHHHAKLVTYAIVIYAVGGFQIAIEIAFILAINGEAIKYKYILIVNPHTCDCKLCAAYSGMKRVTTGEQLRMRLLVLWCTGEHVG